VYGILEAILAGFALATPLLLGALDPLYAAIFRSVDDSATVLTAVRAATGALVLLPPTFLMGATLPTLTREAERGGVPARRRVAGLYAVNTFGAVAGTALTGFVLLPALGVRATLGVGVSVNILVAAIALLAGRPGGTGEDERPAEDETPADAAPLPVPRSLLALAAGVLGFSALALEILWTRTLSLSLGTTTYAYSVVLCVFLLGIAGGSAVAAVLLRGGRRPVGAFLAAPAAVGLFAIALLPIYDRLPGLFLALSARGGGTWAESLLVKVLLAGLPLLPPTLISGAALPLAVGIDSASSTHRSAGDLFAANTLGSILGSWAAGFVLLPLVGLQRGIEIAALLLVATTVVLRLSARRRLPGQVLSAGATGIAGIVLVLLMPAWNRAALTRGDFVLGRDLPRLESGERAVDAAEIVFLREGVTSTVSVRREDGDYTLQINGVTEASTAGDLSTQVSVAALPLLLHEAPRDVLVIGFGGGISAATAAAFPGVETIRVAEISAAVIDGARWFDQANHDVLADPRVDLRVADGRNLLRLSPREYDVVVSLPSHVWNAGIGGLLSSEFYAEARAKLRPGGILCSWIQGYSVSKDALRSVLAAVSRSFPRVSVWRGAWGDLLIVAGGDELTVDAARLAERIDAAARDGGPLGEFLGEGDAADPLAVLSRCYFAGPRVAEWVGSFPPNTDDRPFLEFEAPKLLYRSTMRELFDGLHEAADGPGAYLVNASPGLERRLVEARRARALESSARLAFREGRGDDGLRLLDEAAALHPEALSIARTRANALIARGATLANGGRLREAAAAFVRALEADPGSADARVRLGEIYRDVGDLERAGEAAREARRLDPTDPDPPALEATILLRMRRWEEARAAAEASLAREPAHETALAALGDAWLGAGQPARAESVYVAGLERRPGSEILAAKRKKIGSLGSK
jgi:spermidine synthase